MWQGQWLCQQGSPVASAAACALALGDSGPLLSSRAAPLKPPVLPFPPLCLQKEQEDQHLLCTEWAPQPQNPLVISVAQQALALPWDKGTVASEGHVLGVVLPWCPSSFDFAVL